MVFNNQNSEYNWVGHTKKVGILENETNDVLLASNKPLINTIAELTKHIANFPQQIKSIQ